MTSAITIIFVLYFIQGSLGYGLRQSPTVGIGSGHAVDITDAPFMAALLSNEGEVLCGGSIIHKQFVLTSAICPWNLTVRVGSTHYGDDEGKLHRVEKYITHESFSHQTWLNNVALLKLSEPLTFGPSVSWIELADASVNIPAGLAANVTGWGETETYAFATRELRQASVTVSPIDECKDYYNSSMLIVSDNQVCVNNITTGACYYDNGGPLTAGELQIGIYSYGATCMSHPSVYEKVAPHLQWIRNKIKQNL